MRNKLRSSNQLQGNTNYIAWDSIATLTPCTHLVVNNFFSCERKQKIYFILSHSISINLG